MGQKNEEKQKKKKNEKNKRAKKKSCEKNVKKKSIMMPQIAFFRIYSQCIPIYFHPPNPVAPFFISLIPFLIIHQEGKFKHKISLFSGLISIVMCPQKRDDSLIHYKKIIS